jgi:hypothetical protein
VTSPNPTTVDEAIAFAKLLREGDLPLRAVVANRVNPPPPPSARAELETLEATLGPGVKSADLARRLREALSDAERLARRDVAELSRLRDAGLVPLEIPRLPSDVHDLPSLREVGDLLTAAAEAAP